MLIVTAQQYGNHVKAGWRVVFMVSGKPGEGGLADLPLFERGYCQLRYAVGQGFAALDLDKNDSFALFGDNIHFPAFAAKVSLDDFETVSLQKSRCQLFAPIADPGVFLAGAISPSHGST